MASWQQHFGNNGIPIPFRITNIRMVQGVWGVVPIHLLELSPEHLRAFVIGTTYQLGNLVSSASSTIEAKIGERYPLPPGPNGETRYDYGKVIGISRYEHTNVAIFMGIVYGALAIIMIVGPERMHHDVIMEDRKQMERNQRDLDAKRLSGGGTRQILQTGGDSEMV